ncbi:MAG: hypothetical protein NT024_14045, partial [Proteobacteria bacterium]|nr:hypothetical protein [Pseudomonadota bacterium]
MPLEAAGGLAAGQAARVRMALAAKEAMEGRILTVASVANSGRLMVRVELPNPQHRPAGQQVWVEFGPPAYRPGAEISAAGDRPQPNA